MAAARVARVGVYVDGYNLYYGRLRGSSYKWLDLVKLIESVLQQRDQNERLECVRLFTAWALATFATHGESSVVAQTSYHRALEALHGDRLQITYGRHNFDRSGSLMPAFIEGQPFDRKNRVRVWRLEEKKTDVNLAIRMYRDAREGRFDRIILVSNDSDAEPALQALREDFPSVGIGVVVPVRPAPTGGKNVPRRVSGSLLNLADWVIPSITDEQLAAAQLPDMIPTKRKPIRKPPHW